MFCKSLLCIIVASGHFHQFHLTVKRHHLDPMGRSILDLRNLLAGIGVDNSAWIHIQRLNQLNFCLNGGHRGQYKQSVKLQNNHPSSIQGYNQVISYQLSIEKIFFCILNTLLAQSNPVPRDASVETTMRLSLHFTAQKGVTRGRALTQRRCFLSTSPKSQTQKASLSSCDREKKNSGM